MITEKELNLLNFSATKKDFYQIWNEILETAGKLSERWDPTSTNETDPGIVLLKVLAAVGDKLNYTIDKNILEAFMPTAAQDESMRRICDMMGYAMNYYRSAVTDVTLSYVGDTSLADEKLPPAGLTLPKFTNLTNVDKDINYVTTEEALLTNDNIVVTIPCIEGQLVQCESDTNNIITLYHLDDEHKYYLPESQVAENGIFIYNVSDNYVSDPWECVDNLNTHPVKSKIYRFGYDSTVGRPYIQFPDDINSIIEDGLEIYFIRTSGVNGNISPRTITTFERPSNEDWDPYVDNEKFTVTNTSAVTNGANPETITQAYKSFKKTVGTFDTLVTCRDYINKIYSYVSDKNVPLVSNVIVSDIRDDINRAHTICSFNEYGICYLDESIKEANDKDAISAFDLVLYPFKIYNGTNTRTDYKESFTYTERKKNDITLLLGDVKSIAHNLTYPKDGELVCIKNYLKLNAKISTTNKVNVIEEAAILDNVKTALYKSFNLRELDFGEAIPFDSILTCIEEADPRIKNVALDEPILYTKFVYQNGSEYDLASTITTGTEDKLVKRPGCEAYNKLALRNILAGRVDLFNYNTDFTKDFSEKQYDVLNSDLDGPIEASRYATEYPRININTNNNGLTNAMKIARITSFCEFDLSDPDIFPIELGEHEVIKFKAPNFKTTKTYPAYVNYYIRLRGDSENQSAIPATFQTLGTFLNTKVGDSNHWTKFANLPNVKARLSLFIATDDDNSVTTKAQQYGALFKRDTTETYVYIKDGEDVENGTKCYYIDFTSGQFFSDLVNYIRTVPYAGNQVDSNTGNVLKLRGLYQQSGTASLKNALGYCVDCNHIKYVETTQWRNYGTPLTNYFVQVTYTDEEASDKDISAWHTKDGLGRDAVYTGIPANAEYRLKTGEYLLINYTQSSDSDDGTSGAVVNEVYGPGKIIKPNFILQDSAARAAANKTYSKTSGFDFTGQLAGVFNPTGMYSLASNEQIEVREFVQVKLTSDSTYLYWILSNEQNAITAQTCDYCVGGSDLHYTLKDNEFIYYTNKAKQDYAYYGSGTEIILHNMTLEPDANFLKINAETVDDGGLEVIPWQCYSLSTKSTGKSITINEYQYVTLTEGDKLLSCTLSDAVENKTLNNDWKACDSSTSQLIRYTRGDSISTLPKFAVDGVCWQVRSMLEFAMGPDQAQILKRPGDYFVLQVREYEQDPSENNSSALIDINRINYKAISVYKNDDTNDGSIKATLMSSFNRMFGDERLKYELAPRMQDGEVIPLSLKANQSLNCSLDTVTFNDSEIYYAANWSAYADATATTNIVKIQVCADEPVKITGANDKQVSAPLQLHNVNDRFTKLAMANLIERDADDNIVAKDLSLNISIPDDCYGVMAVYYQADTDYESTAQDGGITYDTGEDTAQSVEKSEVAAQSEDAQSEETTVTKTETKSTPVSIFNNLKKEADSFNVDTYRKAWTWWENTDEEHTYYVEGSAAAVAGQEVGDVLKNKNVPTYHQHKLLFTELDNGETIRTSSLEVTAATQTEFDKKFTNCGVGGFEDININPDDVYGSSQENGFKKDKQGVYLLAKSAVEPAMYQLQVGPNRARLVSCELGRAIKNGTETKYSGYAAELEFEKFLNDPVYFVPQAEGELTNILAAHKTEVTKQIDAELAGVQGLVLKELTVNGNKLACIFEGDARVSFVVESCELTIKETKVIGCRVNNSAYIFDGNNSGVVELSNNTILSGTIICDTTRYTYTNGTPNEQTSYKEIKDRVTIIKTSDAKWERITTNSNDNLTEICNEVCLVEDGTITDVEKKTRELKLSFNGKTLTAVFLVNNLAEETDSTLTTLTLTGPISEVGANPDYVITRNDSALGNINYGNLLENNGNFDTKKIQELESELIGPVEFDDSGNIAKINTNPKDLKFITFTYNKGNRKISASASVIGAEDTKYSETHKDGSVLKIWEEKWLSAYNPEKPDIVENQITEGEVYPKIIKIERGTAITLRVVEEADNNFYYHTGFTYATEDAIAVNYTGFGKSVKEDNDILDDTYTFVNPDRPYQNCLMLTTETDKIGVAQVYTGAGEISDRAVLTTESIVDRGNSRVFTRTKSKTYYKYDPLTTYFTTEVESKTFAIKDEYKLKRGLNIIAFDKSGTLRFEPDLNARATLMFSDLDLIMAANCGINNKLIQYQNNNSYKSPELALLTDLAAADPEHKFFYNCHPSGISVIDLNSLLLSSNEPETLATPSTWYNANNINNKFVISEIDADYLDTGIQISKASKR